MTKTAKIYWLAVVACINGTRFNDRTGAQQTGPVWTGPDRDQTRPIPSTLILGSTVVVLCI